MKVDIKVVFVLVLCFGFAAWAVNDQPARALAGTNLAVAINGSDVWVEDIAAAACPTMTSSVSTRAGQNIMVQADADAHVINGPSTAVDTHTPKIAGDQIYPMGLLQASDGTVSACGVAGATTVHIFTRK